MGEMHGARRVVTFCLLTAVLPTALLVIPLYLRHSLFADVSYSVAESDVIEAVEGMSTVFCQEQILKMNSTFRAFQLSEMPLLSHHQKHIQLKKSMVLPDDTVEYWGFYLLAGSNISLLACSRFQGAGVLVVKGEKQLKTCNSMESQHINLKYQKSNRQIKMAKTGNSREIRDNKSKEESKILMDLLNETRNLAKNTKKTNSVVSMNKEHDPLHELTQEIKKIISDYPIKKEIKDSLQNNFPSENLTESVRKNLPQNITVTNGLISAGTNASIDSIKTLKHRRAVNLLAKQLQNNEDDIDANSDFEENLVRQKRKILPRVTGHVLDAGVGHGGNANVTEEPGESSDSSFEEDLRRCYSGQDMFSEGIYPTPNCSYSHSYHKVQTLNVTSDGYYYFIFYSDNDHNVNPVHVHFDIFKTTYQHTNFTRGCINQTECRFPISFWSSEIVIVEVPTHDGIEHEDGDSSILISSCYPRMSVYAIFPVAVLFLILGCAFL